ncbi:hypothetical protein H1D32_08335 [Anaerobacillus sp. CMMVII]|uniref:hypothetical protein n=1 Tax=Anaerobacillus sp. CMMVII TaxID=2755588 RepID=UPI0021B7D8C6|nr:hypothetical protein [Anaerobacillus sp. CMMVII]MCT8137764.1 hypothetical protein [Anaerobacillus sp. CMMVII]
MTNVIGRIVSNQMIQSLGMIIFISFFLVVAIETWKFSKKISLIVVLLWFVGVVGQALITFFLK